MSQPRIERRVDLATLKDTLLGLVIDSSEDVTVSELLRKYKKQKNEDLPYEELGYRNLLHMIKDRFVGIFSIEYNVFDKNDPILMAYVPDELIERNKRGINNSNSSETCYSWVKRTFKYEQEYRDKIDIDLVKELGDKISNVLRSHPDGVWCADLDDLFLERYHTPIPYERAGFSSVIALVRWLPTKVKVYRPHLQGDYKLFNVNYPLCPRKSPYAMFTQFVETDLKDDTLFNTDVMQPGDIIQRVSISHLKVGQELEVEVTNIYSPSHLWLQQKDDPHYLSYVNMVEEMNAYYNGIGAEQYLFKGAVQKGYYCCGILDGNWHRTVIVEVLGIGCYVKVRFVDFGNVETVDVRSLRVLQKRWAEVPAIAIKARLSKLKPEEDLVLWSTEATILLKNLTAEGQFFAEIAQLDPVAEEIWVHLRNARSEWINDKLLSKGRADCQPYFASQLRFYEFPVFQAIEDAETLSFDEVLELKQLTMNLQNVKKYIHFFPPYTGTVVISDGSRPSHIQAEYFYSSSLYMKANFQRRLKQTTMPTIAEEGLVPAQHAEKDKTLVGFCYEDLIRFQQYGYKDQSLALNFIIEKIVNALRLN